MRAIEACGRVGRRRRTVVLNGLRVYNTSKYLGDAAIDLSRGGAPWRIRVSGNWVGDYSPFDEPGVVLGGYGLAHVSGAWTFRSLEADVGVRNVFDRAYPELVAGHIVSPGQPRTVYVSLRAAVSRAGAQRDDGGCYRAGRVGGSTVNLNVPVVA